MNELSSLQKPMKSWKNVASMHIIMIRCLILKFMFYWKIKVKPDAGLEPVTVGLKVQRSTDWANQAQKTLLQKSYKKSTSMKKWEFQIVAYSFGDNCWCRWQNRKNCWHLLCMLPDAHVNNTISTTNAASPTTKMSRTYLVANICDVTNVVFTLTIW